MAVSEMELYETLGEKLGKHETKALAGFVETKVEDQFNIKLNVVATKEDVMEVRLEINELEVKFTKEIYAVKEGLLKEISTVKESLLKEISTVKDVLTKEIAAVEVRQSRQAFLIGLVQFLA